MEEKTNPDKVAGLLNDLAGLIAISAGMLERIATTLQTTQKVLSNELQNLNDTSTTATR